MLVKLQILEKDIRETKYHETKNCAITKALHRVGLTDYHDAGTRIINSNWTKIITSSKNEDYQRMVEKVIGMYISAGVLTSDGTIQSQVPADFEVELELNL